jgi:PAS domain S-box-containing protein
MAVMGVGDMFALEALFLGFVFSIVAAFIYRKQAKRIEKQKKHIESILATASDGIHVCNMEGDIVLFSDSFAQMIGYSKNEVARLNVTDWEAMHSLETMRTFWPPLFVKAQNFETKHRRKDGTIFDVEVFAKGIVVDGQSYLYASSRDISDRKKIEAELLKHDIVLKSLAEGVYATDADYKCTYINKAALAMLGLDEDEIIGKSPHEVFHYHYLNGKEYPSNQCPISIAALTGKAVKIEDSFIAKTGVRFPVSVTVSPLTQDGSILGSVVIFDDITMQKNIEENLQTLVAQEVSKNKLKDKLLEVVFDSLSFGVFITDKDGYFVQTNEAFCNIVGYFEEELIGRSFEVLFPKESRGFALGLYHDLTCGDAPTSTMPSSLELAGKFGQKISVYASFARIHDENGKLLIVTSMNDITKELELKAKHDLQESIMIQQSKMAEMGDMLGAIIHQWRQPLNAISLMAQNISLDATLGELTPESANEAEKNITSTVKFMSDTMESFRTFFKAQKEKCEFDVENAVEAVLTLLGNQLKHAGIDLNVVRKHDGSLMVLGFENEFKQVALNIINNAKDAIISKKIEDGSLCITLSREANDCILVINDNGGGIPEHLLPDKLFEPYFTTKGENGTGIGLSLAKTIIEQHFSGKLSVHNENNGAAFVIILPLIQKGS